jgi:hypothetical protein
MNGVNWVTKWPLIADPGAPPEPLPGLPQTAAWPFVAQRQQAAKQLPLRVESAALCNGRSPVDVRYVPLATEIAWRCNMSRWAKRATKRVQWKCDLFDQLVRDAE